MPSCYSKISAFAVVWIYMSVTVNESAADAIFFEDFSSYTDGQNLGEGTNPNGWQAEDQQDQAMSWCCGSSIGPGNVDLPLVDDLSPNGNLQAFGGSNAAAFSAIPTQSSGTVTLEYDVRFAGLPSSPGSGIFLKNSTDDHYVGMSFGIGGMQLEVGTPSPTLSPSAGRGYFADHGVTGEPETLAHVVISVDLDAGMVSATATGDVIGATGPHPLGALTTFDKIVLSQSANAAGAHDNITIDGIGGNVAEGTDYTWISAVSGSWQSGSNWSLNGPGPAFPNKVAHNAHFGNAISSPEVVFTNSDVSVNSVSFDSSASYAIAGHGTVNYHSTTDASMTNPSVSVAQGAHSFQAAAAIHANTTVNVASGTSLEFVNRLSLNGNTLTKTGDGTLLINSSFNTGGGTVVNNGGVIGGGGTVGGNVDNSAGTVAPGNSPGILTVTGNYSQGGGGTLEIEIMGSNPGEGGHDQPGQVPEPASWVLALMAVFAAGLMGRRWRS